MKKTIGIILLIVMLVSLVAACGNNQGTTPTPDDTNGGGGAAEAETNGDDEAGEQEGAGEHGEEPTVITMFMMEHFMPEYPRCWERFGQAVMRQALLERFNVWLELDEVIHDIDQARMILNTRLAAGTDIPDIINFPGFSTVDLLQMFEQGLIIDMGQFDVPNIRAVFDEFPTLKINNTGPNGEIINVPQAISNPQMISKWFHIRQDWLDELDLPTPTTTDEFADTLRAFQANDMSGSGRPDEVVTFWAGAMNHFLGQAFGAYGISDASNSWHIDDEGNIIHAMLTDNARNYVAFVAQMFEEGLFWDQVFNHTSEDFMHLQNMNRRAGFFCFYWSALLTNVDGFLNGRPEEFVPIMPLTDGTHPAVMFFTNFLGDGAWVVTGASESPEKAVQVLDWIYSSEGQFYETYGEPYPGGIHYIHIPSLWDDLGLEFDGFQLSLTELGQEIVEREALIFGYLGVKNQLFPLMWRSTNDTVAFEFYHNFDQAATRRTSDPALVSYQLGAMYNGAVQQVALASMTSEQMNILADASDLLMYMDEMFQRFMMGLEPMENWDDFVNRCFELGLGDILEMQQARYEAFRAIAE